MMENSAAEMPPMTDEMSPMEERRHTPSLSGSQKAYLFRREAFLEGIQQRADNLFANGYDVRETAMSQVFLVLCPEVKGMRHAYRVNPAAVTCTCPFFAKQSAGQPLDDSPVPCKHLVGLPRLVHVCCREAIKARRLGRFYRLWRHWQGAMNAQPLLREDWNACGPLHPANGALTPPIQNLPFQGQVSPTGKKGNE